jgi:hypothetical protein
MRITGAGSALRNIAVSKAIGQEWYATASAQPHLAR